MAAEPVRLPERILPRWAFPNFKNAQACRNEDSGHAVACVRMLLAAKADATKVSAKHKLTALHVAAESSPPQL